MDDPMEKMKVDQSSRLVPKKIYAIYVMNKKIVKKVVPDAASWGIMMEMTFVIWPSR